MSERAALRLRAADGDGVAGEIARHLAEALGILGVGVTLGASGEARAPAGPVAIDIRVVPQRGPRAPVATVRAPRHRASEALAAALRSALGGLCALRARVLDRPEDGADTAAARCELELGLPDTPPPADAAARGRHATVRNRIVQALARALAHHLAADADESRAFDTMTRTARSEHFDVWHQVPLVPQLTGMSCWAACAAMIVGWRDALHVEPDEIARGAGHWQAYRDGLEPGDLHQFAATWELELDPRRVFSVADLRELLEERGPLWVGQAAPDLHVLCIAGIHGDGTPDGTLVRINDPWPLGRGERYCLSFRDLLARYRTAGLRGVGAQILYAPQGRHGTSSRYRMRWMRRETIAGAQGRSRPQEARRYRVLHANSGVPCADAFSVRHRVPQAVSGVPCGGRSRFAAR